MQGKGLPNAKDGGEEAPGRDENFNCRKLIIRWRGGGHTRQKKGKTLAVTSFAQKGRGGEGEKDGGNWDETRRSLLGRWLDYMEAAGNGRAFLATDMGRFRRERKEKPVVRGGRGCRGAFLK